MDPQYSLYIYHSLLRGCEKIFFFSADKQRENNSFECIYIEKLVNEIVNKIFSIKFS